MKNSSMILAGNTRTRDTSAKVFESGNNQVSHTVFANEPCFSTNTLRNQPPNKNNTMMNAKNLGTNNYQNNVPITNNKTIVNNIKCENQLVYNKPPVGIRSQSSLTVKKQQPNNNFINLNNNFNETQQSNENVYNNYSNNPANYNYYNNPCNSNYYNNNGNNYQQTTLRNFENRNETMQTDRNLINDNLDPMNVSSYNHKNGLSKPFNKINTIDDDKSVISGISGSINYNKQSNFGGNFSVYDGNFNESISKNLNKSDLGKGMVIKNLKPNFDKKNEVELMPNYVQVMEKETRLRHSKTPNLISPLNLSNINTLNTSTLTNNVNPINNKNKLNCVYNENNNNYSQQTNMNNINYSQQTNMNNNYSQQTNNNNINYSQQTNMNNINYSQQTNNNNINYSQQTNNNNINYSQQTNMNNDYSQQTNVNNNYSQQTMQTNSNVYVKSNIKTLRTSSNPNIISQKNKKDDKIIYSESDKSILLRSTIQSIPTDNTSVISQITQGTGYSLNTIKPTNQRNVNSNNFNNNKEFQTIMYNNNENDNFYVNIEDLMLSEEKFTYIIYVLFKLIRESKKR